MYVNIFLNSGHFCVFQIINVFLNIFSFTYRYFKSSSWPWTKHLGLIIIYKFINIKNYYIDYYYVSTIIYIIIHCTVFKFLVCTNNFILYLRCKFISIFVYYIAHKNKACNDIYKLTRYIRNVFNSQYLIKKLTCMLTFTKITNI